MKTLKNLLVTAATVITMCVLSVVASAASYGNLSYTVSNSTGEVTITNCEYSATEVEIPAEIDGYPVTRIGWTAFCNCEGLTNITIPDSVTSIGNNAFESCTGLTSITIPASVKIIGKDAFGNCTGLTDVYITDISAWCNINFAAGSNPLRYADNLYVNNKLTTELVIPDSVTSIGDYLFNNFDGLTSITIPDSVTSIGDYAFFGCDVLTNVTIPDSVTSIGDYAFSGCDVLTNVTIPDSVTSIGDYAFSGCTGLTSVTIPDSVTGIGDRVFFGCTGLTSVTIPDSVKIIGKEAFGNCTGLTNITIPDSVTSISDFAFYYCEGLTSITIPDSVTSIGDRAFCYCDSLTSITISNPECFIYDLKYTIDSDAVIYGYTGSTAQAYANEYNREFIALDNHVHTEETVTGYAATCTKTGLTDGVKCSVCGEILAVQKEIPMTAHTFGKWTVVKAPTASAEGTEERVCSVCGKKETRDIATLDFVLGDVNGDNQITAEDARFALRLSAGLETLEKLNVTVDVVDYNKDGQITAEDARRILRKSAGLE